MEVIQQEIKRNMAVSILKLITCSQSLSAEPHNFSECKVQQSDELDQAITVIMEELAILDRDDDESKVTHKYSEIANAYEFIWQIEGVQNTYKQRQYFSIVENIHIFFEKAKQIYEAKQNWVPCRRDIVLSRIRTTGMCALIH